MITCRTSEKNFKSILKSGMLLETRSGCFYLLLYNNLVPMYVNTSQQGKIKLSCYEESMTFLHDKNMDIIRAYLFNGLHIREMNNPKSWSLFINTLAEDSDTLDFHPVFNK